MPLKWLAALGVSALLAGCVTTTTSREKLPHDSKADIAENAASVHTQLGQHYLMDGDLKGALEKLKMALKFDPNYVPAHTVIAVVYERINDMPDAEIHYRKAQQLAPDQGATNNNLGAFLCREGKVAEAEGYFRRAVADPFYQNPDVALTNAGICELKSGGNRATAVEDFRNALKRNPHNGDALYHMAYALYLDNDAFNASAFIQRFDALGKPTPEALKLGFQIETRLGDTEDAQSYRQRLLSQFPDSDQAHSLKATAGQ